MDSVIERVTRGHFWQFHGGIHPPEQKFLTSTKPISHAQLPQQLCIPLRQHIGQAGKLLVNVGDHVLKGQALTTLDTPMSVPVHASTSGTVTAIESAMIPHPSGLSEPCLFIKPDGLDTWRERKICPDYQSLSKLEILEKIANAGISGMGGAGFPTQVKVATQASIEYLIINAAECEPYITADDLLIQEHSPTILDGIKVLDHILSPKHILIGIEDNKATAIEILQKITQDIAHIHICVIPTKYPSGGEKQLIKILTGKEVPSGVLPSSLGIVMQNIATCYAIADAVINDSPLIKRVVTVTGQALEKPQNVWALIGTSIGELTATCHYHNHLQKHLIMGGPMMGFSLPSDQIPIIKTTNCILAPSEIEIASPYSSTSSKEVECIRCGQCADACPAQLLPQELQWYAKAKDQKQLTQLNLFDCIECGACAYVCPSQIPLVHYYRVAKAEIRQQKLLDLKAEKAKVRFEARKQRLERDKLARAEKHRKAAEARKARMNANTTEAKVEKSAVAAALARVKAKKAQANGEVPSTPLHESIDEKSLEKSAEKSQVANAIARAKAKKLAQKAQQQELANNDTKTETTNKSSKVAAAVAKAKAKKLAQQALSNNEQQSTDHANSSDNNETAAQEISAPVNPAEDKKSKVAAAVAKAKAKKLAQQAKSNNEQPPTDHANSSDNNETVAQEISAPVNLAEDKKSKVAAAVAKAKAKKLAQQAKSNNEQPSTDHANSSDNNETVAQEISAPVNPAEDKKSKVAAAVAKAKAKKLAQQAKSNNEQPSTDHANSSDNNETVAQEISAPVNPAEDKQAKIAAAIAKAKAKKLATTQDTEHNEAITTKQNTVSQEHAQNSDDKKARIAAAIAKAKAKKIASQSPKSQTAE